MILLDNVGKRFGRVEALKGVSAHVPEGRVTALVGPNGSGKTTLMKSILGLVRPDQGRILLNGEPLGDDPLPRLGMGYMPQVPFYPETLIVSELLDLVALVRGEARRLRPGAPVWSGSGDPETPNSIFPLGELLPRRLRGLSGGTLQRVGAELAWRSAAPLLVLDEPTAGLDPLASAHLKDRLLADRARDRTILVSSHVLADLQELADHVVFLLDGRVRYNGDLAGLLELTGETRLERAVARLMAGGAA